MGLSSFASSQILTEDAETNWVRARAIAEAFKSEAYRYQQKAAPYNEENPEQLLFDRTEELIRSVSDVPSASITPEQEREQIIPLRLSFEEYLKERVQDQVYNYYLPKSQRYKKLLSRGKNWGLSLGFAGIILGTLSASGFDRFSVWLAFITSTAASVTSFTYAGRYQDLMISYQAAAQRLTRLLSRKGTIAPNDRSAQQAFVASCEEAICMENQAWLSESSSK